ncbi:MAG: methyltransferase domain-containing protein [Sneathiella sp.]|nr:methyltransferase domain-containing protein [Sneathiella sp.]
MTTTLQCRFCKSNLTHTLVDLGKTPLANSYLKDTEAIHAEKEYPLHARVCGNCFLVQVEDVVPPEEIFSDYAYFSSYSESWVEHARQYANKQIDRFSLDANSLVMEVASNDGYLLQHFIQQNIPVLGIEPAANVAKVAEAKGVKTEVAFFGTETAKRLISKGLKADLIAANNVMAHVPDINDFIAGFKIVLSQQGVLTIEFPHLLNLINYVQFDTIYHEHYSYLSLLTVEKILKAHNLKVFDVDELSTHGGSLRVYASHDNRTDLTASKSLERARHDERISQLDKMSAYQGFAPRVEHVREALLSFLEQAKKDGKKVVAYGAAAKGNTLLNFCGIGTNLLEFVVDRNIEKQNKYLPGSHLFVYAPSKITEAQPDFVLILPWNLADEISSEMAHIKEWGGKFAVPIPELDIIS